MHPVSNVTDTVLYLNDTFIPGFGVQQFKRGIALLVICIALKANTMSLTDITQWGNV